MSTRVSRGRVTRPASSPVGAAGSAVPRPEADAAERKRLRDRVAQQNLRNKRNRHIQALEEQVKLCQELHRSRSGEQTCGSGHSDEDLKTIQDLRAENEALKEQQKQMQALFQSFKNVFEPASAATTAAATPAPAVPDVPKAPGVQEVPIATDTNNNEAQMPHQSPQSSPNHNTPPEEPTQPTSPPPPPQQQTAPSPVSSASTTEVVISSTVPTYIEKIPPTMETLPDYSMWLAGIGHNAPSTDSESEPEMIHGTHYNQTQHLQMDEAHVNGVTHQHSMTSAYTMQPPGVPLAATTPSIFDTQQSQFTTDITDMWTSRIPAPMPTSIQATAADIAASYDSAMATYNPFMYTARPQIAAATPTTTAADDNNAVDTHTQLNLWTPSNTAAATGAAEIPEWARIPVRTSGPNDVRRPAWDANMRIIFDSPDVPAPLDLLFGSNQNPLASSLQRSIKTYYQGNPERLAVGWLTYHYIKWRTRPSAESYASLPHFLKPIFEQIWVPHPGSIDLIVWEKMRLKMLKLYDRYDMVKFIRTYCRCLRLRWRWDEDILVANAEGMHVLRPDFVERMMNASGWGLKPEFVTYYPELFDGDEWDQVVYNPGARHIV